MQEFLNANVPHNPWRICRSELFRGSGEEECFVKFLGQGFSSRLSRWYAL